MSHSAVTPAPRVLLDEESIRRTLSRIAHEIIERNDDLETVALVGIHTRGVPLAHRLRHLIEERSGEELALGQLDITFHRDDVHVRSGQAPRHRQPIVRDTKLDFELEGRTVTIRTPGEALDAGIAYLTEDRRALGLFLDMSCLDNINLAVLGKDARLGYILDRNKARDRANSAFATLGIRAANVGVTAGGLSGGNQQKVLLSRLLAATPKVLILDEPTRGVDVGAKSEIYSIIDNSAKSGAAILVISSDLPEIIGICDRVLVMRTGRIAGEITRGATSPLNQEDIMALATGTEQLDAS